MNTKTAELLNYFQNHGGTARFSTVLKAGFHSDTLKALEKAEKLNKIARGLYRVANYELGSHPDLVAASLQAPRGIICLVSALAFHEATDEIPHWIDIAIPKRSRANRIKYPPVRFYHFAPETWEAGIEEYKIESHNIRVYSLAKTIADCFKFRNRIGLDVARAALKVAILEKNTKPNEIMKFAKLCRVDGIVKPIVEAIL
jgi:predicted transcriptional regulator of viral defense system